VTKISYTVDIRAPIEGCFRNIKACLEDERYKKVCSNLVSTRYIQEIIEETENKSIIIKEIAVDTMTGLIFKNFVLIHSYMFSLVSDNVTRIDISIEYSRLVALLGLGIVKPQVKDRIIWAVKSLISYENGFKDNGP